MPCQTVADCWLGDDSKPIKRPAAKKGKPLPRGDCGTHLKWLRNQLSCTQNVCTAKYVGDMC